MHIEPTQAQGRAFFGSPPDGPVVMLNLLRFRDVADYTAHPDLAPETPISGAEAYHLYEKHAAPFVLETGGEVLFDGAGGPYLIGPDADRWDRVLLVRHVNAQVFLSFTSNPEYMRILGHRAAALEDSRLLPIVQR